MTTITVLLADDHAVVRSGFRALLEAEHDIEVVAEAEDGRKAVQLTKELLPAVVVMDIGMPGLNGLEAARQILATLPATKILILSAHGDDEYVERAMQLGASGFLIKQSSATLLYKAIRDTFAGQKFFSPTIAKRLRDNARREPIGAKGRRRASAPSLTSREVEVLQLIAEGSANKQTAATLSISIKTVEKHRQNLMLKLGIHDTAGLTRYAIANGIIEGGVKFTLE